MHIVAVRQLLRTYNFVTFVVPQTPDLFRVITDDGRFPKNFSLRRVIR